VRVVARDTGGNFGTRNSFFPEFALVAWAAGRLGRPVKWTCERGEAFLSDYQGRDLTVAAELALDSQGNFLALRSSNLSNAAAHAHGFDRLELRRRNLIPESAMPYRNPFGLSYDSGAYAKVMSAALALGDWEGFPARRDEARRRGRLRGIALANYVEVTSGFP